MGFNLHKGQNGQKVLTAFENDYNLGATKIEKEGVRVGSYIVERGSNHILVVEGLNEMLITAAGLRMSEAGDMCVAFSKVLEAKDAEVRDPSHVTINGPLWQLREDIVAGRVYFFLPPCKRLSEKRKESCV